MSKATSHSTAWPTVSVRSAVIFLAKLVGGAFTYMIGMIAGGMIATWLGLPAPILPPEMDASATTAIMFGSSPLLIVALYLVNRNLAGGWILRGAMLFVLSWFAYSVNNVFEAVIFTNYATAPMYTLVTFLPAVAFSAIFTARLFPSAYDGQSVAQAWRAFFHRRSLRDWIWRLVAAALIFIPIYYLFGLLVVPIVGESYRQGDFGLALPSLSTLLWVLLVRSLLFLLSSLPVIVAWQGSRRSLVFSLGMALFVMVGLLYMLAATWIAAPIRLIHSLEILADSVVYAWALGWLLAREPLQPNVRTLTSMDAPERGIEPHPTISP